MRMFAHCVQLEIAYRYSMNICGNVYLYQITFIRSFCLINIALCIILISYIFAKHVHSVQFCIFQFDTKLNNGASNEIR